MILVISIALGWLVCGILAYGFTFAYFQRQYHEIADMREEENSQRELALILCVCGIIGLLVTLLSGGAKHGLLFRKEKEEKEEKND